MKRQVRAALIGLLAAVALVAAACGGDGDGPLTVGDEAPAFELPDASGGTVSLADFGGEPVLLYFHMAEG